MEPEKKSNGALIGSVIIIIILIIGGIYIWSSNKKSLRPAVAPQTQTGAVTNQDSAALDSLNSELNSTSTSTGVNVNSVN